MCLRSSVFSSGSVIDDVESWRRFSRNLQVLGRRTNFFLSPKSWWLFLCWLLFDLVYPRAGSIYSKLRGSALIVHVTIFRSKTATRVGVCLGRRSRSFQAI